MTKNRRRTILAVVLAPILFLGSTALLRAFVIEAFKIPSGAMAPTILVGDHIFVRKWAARKRAPARGDIIVFKYPDDPDKDFIKRVIAVGGDTVELSGGAVEVNGTRLPRERVGHTRVEDDQGSQELDEYHE